jgi:hypothetical protein
MRLAHLAAVVLIAAASAPNPASADWVVTTNLRRIPANVCGNGIGSPGIDPCALLAPQFNDIQRPSPIAPVSGRADGNTIQFSFSHADDGDVDHFCFQLWEGDVGSGTAIFSCRIHEPDMQHLLTNPLTVSGFANDGKTYSWRAKEYRSEWSSVGRFTNGAPPPPQVPGAPTGLRIEDDGDSVIFDWDPRPGNENVTRYAFTLVPGTNRDGPTPNCGTGTSVVGLSCGGFADDGREYTWFLRACNNAGCSASSQSTFTNGPTRVPDPPELLDPAPDANSNCPGCDARKCLFSAAGDCTCTKIQICGGGTLTMTQFANGRTIYVDPADATATVRGAVSPPSGASSEFQILTVGPGPGDDVRVAIQAPDGRYWTLGSDGTIQATASRVGPWETFSMSLSPLFGFFWLRAPNDQYLTVPADLAPLEAGGTGNAMFAGVCS